MRTASAFTRLALSVAALTPVQALGAAPLADELARCAGIVATDARLECYDALSHRAAELSSAQTSAPVASSAPHATPQSPPPAADDPANFGLNPSQLHVETLVKSEEALVITVARGELGQATVVLDNGQSWQVAGDDGWISKGIKVSIKRAALGAFLMHTPSNHIYHVHRVS